MCNFDMLQATTIADLCERGFQLTDSATMISASMLPVREFSKIGTCFAYKSGSIANFREIYITYASYDDEAEEYILSVVEHTFAESGEWYVDSESVVYKRIPESHISEYLRNKYIFTKQEYIQHIEERRAKLRAKRG